MKRKNGILPLVLLGIVFAVFLIRRWNEPVPKEAFDRHPRKLVYSAGALCRMACSGISRQEIQEIMQKGIIHFNFSDRRARPCPTFALQGRTTGGERIRVIFAQCPRETNVINCYQLGESRPCSCTGDKPKTDS